MKTWVFYVSMEFFNKLQPPRYALLSNLLYNSDNKATLVTKDVDYDKYIADTLNGTYIGDRKDNSETSIAPKNTHSAL